MRSPEDAEKSEEENDVEINKFVMSHLQGSNLSSGVWVEFSQLMKNTVARLCAHDLLEFHQHNISDLESLILRLGHL